MSSDTINLTLKIWRQDSPTAVGRFDQFDIEVSPDSSFLEMLDEINNSLEKKGEEPRRIVKKELQNSEGLHSSLIFTPDYSEVYWSLNSQVSVTLRSVVDGAVWSKPEIRSIWTMIDL